jgi:hypothetical protein
MEITMLKAFCAAANLRNFVKGDQCPDIIRTCAPILEECCQADTRGTLMHDIRTMKDSINNKNDQSLPREPWIYDRTRFQRLEIDIYDALISYSASRDLHGLIHGADAFIHSYYTIRGLHYAEIRAGGKNSGGRNSIIYFRPTCDRPFIPALIRKIFSIPQKNGHGVEEESVFLAVQRYKALTDVDGVQDPFLQYGAFGAQLWSTALYNVEVITPDQVVCHGNRRPWKDGVIVLKANNRVSRSLSSACLRTHEVLDRTSDTNI